MSELIFESYSGMILFWFFPLFVNFFCFSFENIGEENFANLLSSSKERYRFQNMTFVFNEDQEILILNKLIFY